MSIAMPKILRSGPVLGMIALLAVLAGATATRLATANASADTNYPAPAASQTEPTDPAALIARGKYLTQAADCMPCHTGPNHAPFSGGLVLNTPFGGLASRNITPDEATGIGNWTSAQFYRAIHDGISPGRSYLIFPKYLYPAMPFTSYTKLTYPDVMAIKAYLDSLRPVSVAPTPSTMMFPFSQRPVLLGWRILFFRPGPMQADPGWNADVLNGAYLTEALGHCGECHTPRNIMGAMIMDKSYAGAPIDAFYAPNISSDTQYGVGGWSKDELVSYLYDGGNATKGSAFGPMGEVVQYSLSKGPKSDVEDIALYLQTVTAPRRTPPLPAVDGGAAAAKDLGASVYASNCAGCHQADGTGRPPIIPNLAGNDAVMATYPYNVTGAILNGLAPWNNGPAMPAFATALSDEEIAAVANYVRTSWGNTANADVAPKDVKKARALAAVPPAATQAADNFGCPHVSGAGGASALADPGSGLLEIYAGATPQTVPNRTRALITALRASNASITDSDLTNYLVAAYCPVVANQPGLTEAAKQKALSDFLAGALPLVQAKS